MRALLNPREKREKKGKKRNILSIEREGSSEKKREKERERERERLRALVYREYQRSLLGILINTRTQRTTKKMKFGHQLASVVNNTAEDIRDKFLQYKALKKTLKSIPSGNDNPEIEKEFIRLLQHEVMKFNEFFINKEEELVMKESRMNVMFSEIVGEDKLFVYENANDGDKTNISADRATLNEKNEGHAPSSYQHQHQQMANATTVEANNLETEADLCVQLANFHGELVLMEHWTNINFTALVKILKKHDKLSRVALRSPILVSVSKQPFYDTTVLSKMISRVQARVECLVSRISNAAGGEEVKAHILTNIPTTTDLAKQTMSARRKVRLSSDGDLLEEFVNADKESLETTYGRTLAALNAWNSIKNSESSQNPFGDVPKIRALQHQQHHKQTTEEDVVMADD